MSMFGGESSIGVMTCFSNPFGITVTEAPMLINCYDLYFCSDYVKELFDIVTERCTAVGRELLFIFKEHNIVQSQIID